MVVRGNYPYRLEIHGDYAKESDAIEAAIKLNTEA